MNALPIDLVRNILSYRGTDAFEALHTELINQKKHTQKWLQEILSKIVDADQNDEISHKEYLILVRIYNKYTPAKHTKAKAHKFANTLDN
jgi:hypothetical protein